MRETIIINNCGSYRNVAIRDLYTSLLRCSSKVPNSEHSPKQDENLDRLLYRIYKITQIQIYSDGVVRAFLEHGHFEKRQSLFFDNFSNEILSILRGCEGNHKIE